MTLEHYDMDPDLHRNSQNVLENKNMLGIYPAFIEIINSTAYDHGQFRSDC